MGLFNPSTVSIRKGMYKTYEKPVKLPRSNKIRLDKRFSPSPWGFRVQLPPRKKKLVESPLLTRVNNFFFKSWAPLFVRI